MRIAVISALAVMASNSINLGCTEDKSGAARERHATMIAAEQAAVAVGMPAIKLYTEKRQLKAIYELRDRANIVTYSYTLDLNGKRHKVCPITSVGFGIPYATQFTAPKAPTVTRPSYPDGTQTDWHTWDAEQPEPNALFMPSSAEGTWVICLHPVTKELAPTYVEPRVVVYLFEMPAVD